MQQIKDYKLIQKTDNEGNIYYEGEIISNKNETYIIYVCEKGKELLEKHKWCVHKKKNNFYLERIVLFHREISECPSNLQPDHINRNGLDNRLCNLRNVSKTENGQNVRKQKNCSSKYIGVSFDKTSKNGKNYCYWRSYININKKRISLGKFKSEKIAALSYNYAAKKLGFLSQNNNSDISESLPQNVINKINKKLEGLVGLPIV